MAEFKEHKVKLKSVQDDSITTHNLIVTEGRSNQGGHILWKVELHFFNKKIRSKSDLMLSNCINEIRTKIEPKGYLLLIKWSEIDAHQSGMLGDMSAGSLMYKMSEVEEINNGQKPSNGYPSYDILTETSPENAVTLDIQNRYLSEKRGRPINSTQTNKNWIQRLFGI